MRLTTPLLAAAAALLVTAGHARAQSIAADSAWIHAFPRRVIVQADSVRIEVARDSIGWKAVQVEENIVLRPDTTVRGGFARVRLVTPTGTFSIRADSVTVAAWADSAATLHDPVPVKQKRGGRTELSLSGVLLREVNGATVMRIVRLTSGGDSLPVFQLDASNGGWGGGVRLTPAQSRAVFDALRGPALVVERDSDVVRAGDSVDVKTKRLDGPQPMYPPLAQQQGVSADVQLAYIVGADGRAEPASLELAGNPIPEFAVAVRESVLRSRYAPALRNGRPVRMQVQQHFSFRLQ